MVQALGHVRIDSATIPDQAAASAPRFCFGITFSKYQFVGLMLDLFLAAIERLAARGTRAGFKPPTE